MTRKSASTLFFVVLTTTFTSLPLATFAQNPFDDNAGAASNPLGGDATGDIIADGELSAAAAERQKIRDERDPVVLAVRESQPKTTHQITRALQVMMDIGRYDEAKRYFDTLDQANIPEAELAALQKAFGSAFFMRVGRRPEFAPRGRVFAREVFDASGKIARDPARIKQLVADLSRDEAGVRRAAISELKNVGTPAINPLLNVLHDESRSNEHVPVQYALSQMSNVLTEPLIAGLATENEAARIRLLQVFGAARMRRAVPYVAGIMYSTTASDAEKNAASAALTKINGGVATAHEVESYLYRKTKSLLGNEFVGERDEYGEVEVWLWNETQKDVTVRRVQPSTAATYDAARHATALHRIAPDNPDYRRLFIVSTLMRDKLLGGLEWPLNSQSSRAFIETSKIKPVALEDALSYAIRHKHVAGAIGIVEVLGAIGTEELVVGQGLSPLASCLRHPDRRLRFAAMDAILRINPPNGFPGSSYLAETLGYLTSTVGQSSVLVAHPREYRAQTIVGMLAQMNFEGDIATTGEQVLRRASRNPDYEFILLSDGIGQPELSRLLEQLRRNVTTARTPIAIMARAGRVRDAQDVAARYEWTEAFPFNSSISEAAAYEVSVISRGENRTRVEDVIAQVRSRDEFKNMTLRITATGSNLVDANYLAKGDPLLTASGIVIEPSTFRDVNFELSVIGDGTPLTSLLTFLKSSSPARGLEISVKGTSNSLNQVRKITSEDTSIGTTERLTDLSRVALMISRLTDKSAGVIVGRDERLRQAERSLDWLGRLVENPKRYAYYDFARQQKAIEVALSTPGLGEKAADVLGNIATPHAQEILVTVASQTSRPLAQRQAAALAFSTAVDRSGILLTTEQIAVQYDRYNQSEFLDKGTQKVLGYILDTIEKPTAPAQAAASPASE